MLQPQAKTPKQIEHEERAQARQALQQRAKELARKRAVSDFRSLLRHRHGSVIAGWRHAIDSEEEQVTFEAFEAAADALKFTGDLDGLWEELVAEHEEVLLLERLEPALVEAKKSFLYACADRYGSVERAFFEMDIETKPLVGQEDFNRLCIEINMQKNRRLLFEYADIKGVDIITLETLEPEAATDVFGKTACAAAQEHLAELEPPSKARKSIMRRAVEQCAESRRPPEEQRQRRQELVEMLEERFGSPVRAWANLLDIHAKGKLKRKEFQTSMSVLGYKGNINQLWDELGLKPKQSVRPPDTVSSEAGVLVFRFWKCDTLLTCLCELRFKDLCPEVIDEIREFKNLAGKKIVTLIQVSEVAAGPGKSKKAGAPVEADEYYKVMNAIDYPGDPDRLLQHLDPGNVGYVNTRTLRILNEQHNEEKAVPLFLRKYHENRQSLLEQKIAAVVIPPAKELLAKQDTMRGNVLEEWNSKKDARDAREEFIRALQDKFGSIAKAWRLALDPELKLAIENVDQLMKALKRAGLMPPEGGEHALRFKAERIFQACMSKETEQISLDCLDPKTPAMLEKFKDLCEDRYGSLQDAFESVDVDGMGIVSREAFRVLCHEVKATDGIFRLMEFLDPKRTGEIRLSLIDSEVAEDAMLATQMRRQIQERQQQSQEQTDGALSGIEHAAQERAKQPARRAVEKMKQRLSRKHGSMLRAWKNTHGSVTKEIGRDGWLRFFEQAGIESRDAIKAWDMVPKTEEKLTLAQFEPRIGKDFEALQIKIKERFGNNFAMMLEMDDGSCSMDYRRFLELCYECKFSGNERRTFEFLEKDDGRIGFEKIDEKAAKDLKAQIAEEEKKRKEEERRLRREERKREKAKEAKEQKKGHAADEAWEAHDPDAQVSQAEEPQKPKLQARRPKPPAGLGHLCLAMKPLQVRLKKATSLPSLRVGLRAQWNDRHHVADHRGNRDMNIIHTLTAIETQDEERCMTRVRRQLTENPTMEWFEEQLRLEEERNAQIWAPDVELEDEEDDEEEDEN
ncbi:unnamed protein product [Effrenium voratum]|nr:unnamed protein product [Effrenium voratum]